MIHFLLQLIKILIQNDDPSARATDPIWNDSRNCSVSFAITIQIIESTESDISSSIRLMKIDGRRLMTMTLTYGANVYLIGLIMTFLRIVRR